uniref:Cadherin-related tumor suppressor n=1 Tax=Aceria tosichella TaxID=561515 RepID=A0A6G1SGJ3_9ACAR
MMHPITLIKMSQHRKRHHRHRHLTAACSLLFFWCLQQLNLTSALYLSQPQLAADQLTNNGAIMQAISQFTAQQLANGLQPGSSPVVASMGPNGAVSIQSGNSNNQNIGLVNTNSNITNQTMTVSAQAANTNSQQQSGAGSNQFVIKFIHNDPKNQMAYVSITPVNYTNLHEPRIELRYQSKYPYVSMPEGSPNNTVVAAVVVQDEDTGPNGETTLSIEQGNELGHFKLVSTAFTNTIQVNGPLSRHRVPEYNLTIVARDHGSPPKSSSSNLVIKVHQAPNQASIQPLEPSPKPPVTDLMYVGTMLVLMFAAVVILIIFGCALVQRPHKASKHSHKGPPPTRTTSASNSRIISPTDQCSAYCMSNGYNLTNLTLNHAAGV